MIGNQYKERIMCSLPLLLGALFMIYLAAFDDTIFDYVLDYTVQNRITVAAATVAATAPLMFFAIGFLKQSVFRDWQAIYQYERLLEHSIFWVMSVVLLSVIMTLNIIEEGVHLLNIHIFVGCVGFSAYLAIQNVIKKNAI